MNQDETQKLRNHILEMRAKAQNLRWEANTLTTRAEAIELEYIRLETLVDKLETTQA